MVTTFAEQGIQTVFEGIEEGWQLELAERSGATMVQGYALARPEIAPTSFAQFRPAARAGPARRRMRRQTPPVGEPARKPHAPQRTFGRRTARP